jgi:hypothetical protein
VSVAWAVTFAPTQVDRCESVGRPEDVQLIGRSVRQVAEQHCEVSLRVGNSAADRRGDLVWLEGIVALLMPRLPHSDSVFLCLCKARSLYWSEVLLSMSELPRRGLSPVYLC